MIQSLLLNSFNNLFSITILSIKTVHSCALVAGYIQKQSILKPNSHMNCHQFFKGIYFVLLCCPQQELFLLPSPQHVTDRYSVIQSMCLFNIDLKNKLK